MFAYSDFIKTNQFYFLLNEERRGFNPATPGRSCKDIVINGIPVRSGEYWIDPENSGNPFKVFCDMSTNGGTYDLVKITKIILMANLCIALYRGYYTVARRYEFYVE